MNKKIKIIELYNMIANKEKVPKKIIYNNEIYHTNVFATNYFSDDNGVHLNFADLNDYVEILEDNTEEIEELKKEQEAIANPKTMMQEIRFYYDSNKMGDKINEIIRYIKRKDKSNDN